VPPTFYDAHSIATVLALLAEGTIPPFYATSTPGLPIRAVLFLLQYSALTRLLWVVRIVSLAVLLTTSNRRWVLTCGSGVQYLELRAAKLPLLRHTAGAWVRDPPTTPHPPTTHHPTPPPLPHYTSLTGGADGMDSFA